MDVRGRRLVVFWGICNPHVILTINVHVLPTWDLWLGMVRVYGDWEIGVS